jgi:hypothetical protein
VVLALPLGGGKLPGIAAEDIGRCAYGIFQRGPEVAGQRFGIAGDVLSGPEYAAAFSRHLKVPVSFYDMPFDDYRALGFPGADDMGNMYEHHAILGEKFRRHRSPEVARALNEPTRYRESSFPMKVFVMERLITLVLETHPFVARYCLDVRAAPASLIGAPDLLGYCVICDALKGQYRKTHDRVYLEQYLTIRARLLPTAPKKP